MDYLKKELSIWCREWTKFLVEFEHISASLDNKLVESPMFFYCNYITVGNQKFNWTPFHAYVGHCVNDSGGLCLYLRHTESVDWIGMAERGRPAYREENYIWNDPKRQLIPDPEIIEKEFVLRLLNTALITFLDQDTDIEKNDLNRS
jgi:hypothetical protein